MNQKNEQQTLTGTFAQGTSAPAPQPQAEKADAYAGMMGYPYNVQVVSRNQKV